MFKPLPMTRARFTVMRADAPRAAALVADCAVLAPLPVSDERLTERPGAAWQGVYHSAQGRLEKIQTVIDLPPPAAPSPEVEEDALRQADERLGILWRACSALLEQQRGIAESRKHLAELEDLLAVFHELDFDLGLPQSRQTFLEFRLGTLPRDGLARFERALSLAPEHISQVFHVTPDHVHVLVAWPRHHGGHSAKLLGAVDFRPLSLPPEFHAHPATVAEELQARRDGCDRQDAEVARQRAALATEWAAELARHRALLHAAAPYAAVGAHLRGSRLGLVVLEGWVPERALPELRAALAEKLDAPFALDARPPRPGEHAPTLLDHPGWLHPFARLVENFGVPRYGEVDPTWLFTLSSILMFGMMFGDVGHGALIALAGWWLRERLGPHAPLVYAAGLSSVVFGGLYGSVFGYEEFFHAWWVAPITQPMLLLQVALLWGIGFILLASVIKTLNLLAEGRRWEAWFGFHGLAGIALYLGGLWLVVRAAQGQPLGWAPLIPALALAIAMARKWRDLSTTPFGEKVIVVGIAGFDSIMNAVSNTLSFLRVAAFSLNHAALAIAVFTLAHGMSGAGHWATVVAGNLFILVLEGAIVGIQVLRLEYYEGFARFFHGDGRAFMPLRSMTKT